MTHSFTYKAKSPWLFIFLPLVGIVFIVYALMEPFTLKFKNYTALDYPNSKYVAIAVGAILLAYGIHKILKTSVLNKNAEPIITTDNELEFNYLKMYSSIRIKLLYSMVTELWNKEDKEDGESITLHTSDKNRYEFFANYFASTQEFATFKNILQEKCTNISNKK